MNEALLLIGPTGSGKTPLGICLQDKHLWSRRCVHFDFGARLRAASDKGPAANFLSEAEIVFIRQVLHDGALLEDEKFYLAEKVLRAFIQASDLGQGDLIVLNGLPRHVGQARDMNKLVSVDTVVCLDCSAETVLARIGQNSGGDRTGRTDDDIESVRRRLAIFDERIGPLVDHYRLQHKRIEHLTIEDSTTADELWQTLEARAR